MRNKIVLGLSIALLVSTSAFSQTDKKTTEALSAIADFADRLCQTVPLDTSSDKLQLTGTAKAELDGLVKKLASLGISGTAKYESESTKNVLQKDLATVLSESRQCRLQIWNDLKGKFNITAVDRSQSVANGCPGNYLTGEHRPEGGHLPWSWSLDSKTGIARIWKTDSAVSGRVDMSCSNGKWSARLFEMTHGVTYNCNGTVSSGRLNNADCTASVPPRILVTGVFSNTTE